MLLDPQYDEIGKGETRKREQAAGHFEEFHQSFRLWNPCYSPTSAQDQVRFEEGRNTGQKDTAAPEKAKERT